MKHDVVLRGGIELIGRALLVALFVLSGAGKISNYAATSEYMAGVGVPTILLPLAIFTEIAGSVAILVGWRVRAIAALLAGFSLLTAFIFHSDLGDQIQLIMFLKNVSITGAFLMLAANGAGRYSLDERAAT